MCADGFVREGEFFVKYHFYGKRQFISVIGGAIIFFAGPSFCVHEKSHTEEAAAVWRRDSEWLKHGADG